jgi:IS30 family transposase
MSDLHHAQADLPIAHIAAHLRRNESTILRELSRNSGAGGHRPTLAQRLSE